MGSRCNEGDWNGRISSAGERRARSRRRRFAPSARSRPSWTCRSTCCASGRASSPSPAAEARRRPALLSARGRRSAASHPRAALRRRLTIKGVQRLLEEDRGRPLATASRHRGRERAGELLRVVSARAEAMASRPRESRCRPATIRSQRPTTPRAAMLDLRKQREIETMMGISNSALTQLRSTLKQQN